MGKWFEKPGEEERVQYTTCGKISSGGQEIKPGGSLVKVKYDYFSLHRLPQIVREQVERVYGEKPTEFLIDFPDTGEYTDYVKIQGEEWLSGGRKRICDGQEFTAIRTFLGKDGDGRDVEYLRGHRYPCLYMAGDFKCGCRNAIDIYARIVNPETFTWLWPEIFWFHNGHSRTANSVKTAINEILKKGQGDAEILRCFLWKLKVVMVKSYEEYKGKQVPVFNPSYTLSIAAPKQTKRAGLLLGEAEVDAGKPKSTQSFDTRHGGQAPDTEESSLQNVSAAEAGKMIEEEIREAEFEDVLDKSEMESGEQLNLAAEDGHPPPPVPPAPPPKGDTEEEYMSDEEAEAAIIKEFEGDSPAAEEMPFDLSGTAYESTGTFDKHLNKTAKTTHTGEDQPPDSPGGTDADNRRLTTAGSVPDKSVNPYAYLKYLAEHAGTKEEWTEALKELNECRDLTIQERRTLNGILQASKQKLNH